MHFTEEEMNLMVRYYELAIYKIDHPNVNYGRETLIDILRCYALDLLSSISRHVEESSVMALRRMLDSILSALLPSVQPGVLKLVSKLTVQNYILSLEINGTVNELRIPLHNEF